LQYHKKGKRVGVSDRSCDYGFKSYPPLQALTGGICRLTDGYFRVISLGPPRSPVAIALLVG
ncbi:hypothetical protein BgiBS90_035874, partial [Biomphalaria glabrata]